MKRHAIKAFLFLACLAMGTAFAHEDMIFPIDADGAVGRGRIPAEYGPVVADIRFSGDDGTPIASVTLHFKDHTTVLPRCLTEKLRSAKLADVEVTGSWWHDEQILPPYLNFTFSETGSPGQPPFRPGHALLFNLRTGKLIEMRFINPIGGGTLRRSEVDVASRCSEAEMRALMAPK